MTRLSIVETVLAALVGLAYLYRVFTLERSGEAPPAARVLCFCLGVAVAIVAAIAFEGPGRQLVYLLTIQQLLLGDLAALLLLLGLTPTILAPLRAMPLLERLKLARHPAVALPLWTANMLAWHFRAPCELALDHHSIMLLQHLLLVGLGVAMWASLLSGWSSVRTDGDGRIERQAAQAGRSSWWPGSDATRPARDDPQRVLRPGRWTAYALTWRLLGAALGAGGIWSPIVFYPHYVASDVAHTLSPLADQGIAGAITLGVSAIVAVGLLVWLYVRLGEGRPALDAQADTESAALTGEARV